MVRGRVRQGGPRFLSVNLMGYGFCAKAAVPLMLRNKGGALLFVDGGMTAIEGYAAGCD
jgi:hypothetical protein